PPLGRGGLLGGKVVAVVAVQIVQVIVLGGIALGLGWRPALAGIPAAIVTAILGTAAFTALALLLAGTLRAEAVLAGANLLWVLLLAGGGILLPGPAWTSALPSGALGDALRLALGHGGWSLWPLVVLGLWTALLTWACVRLFRWSCPALCRRPSRPATGRGGSGGRHGRRDHPVTAVHPGRERAAEQLDPVGHPIEAVSRGRAGLAGSGASRRVRDRQAHGVRLLQQPDPHAGGVRGVL